MNRAALAAVTLCTLSLCIALAAPRTAEACSCGLPELGVAPADGAVNVPTNARLWMGGASPEPSLLDASGQRVAGAVTIIDSSARWGEVMAVFTPDAPLTPGAIYTGRGQHGRTTFTVGSGPDTTPPPVPSITSRRHDPGRTFGGTFGGTDCDSADDRLLTLGVADRAIVTLVNINGTASLTATVPQGAVSLMSVDDEVNIGKAACVDTWQGTGDIAVRLGTYDIAGNFSGWSEESSEVVETVGCSCDSTSPSQGGVPLLAALGLGLLLRRRQQS